MSILDKIFNFFKKIWNFLRPFLAIVALALAVYFTFGGALTIPTFAIGGFTFGGMVLSGVGAAILAGGAALLLDADTVVDVVETVSETLGTAAGAVIAGVTSGLAAGIAGSSFGTYALIGITAFGIWTVLNRRKREAVIDNDFDDSNDSLILDDENNQYYDETDIDSDSLLNNSSDLASNF